MFLDKDTEGTWSRKEGWKNNNKTKSFQTYSQLGKGES